MCGIGYKNGNMVYNELFPEDVKLSVYNLSNSYDKSFLSSGNKLKTENYQNHTDIHHGITRKWIVPKYRPDTY